MDDFLTLGVLLVIGSVVGWWMGVLGWFGARRARREIAEVRAALAAAGIAMPGAADSAAAPAVLPYGALPEQRPDLEDVPEASPAALARPWDAPAVSPMPDLLPDPEPEAASPSPPPRVRPGLEEALTQRWGVWLGAVAILMSGVFLVRYAAEQGWLGPAARCLAAAALGVALVAAAEWLRRRPIPDGGRAWPDQTPAALAAGGAAVIFGAAYGAAVLYALVPPLLGFALLGGAALAGLALALVFGPLVAAVGIVGAYATPALVETADPSLPGLFLYLLTVTGAALAVVRRVGASWLGWAATVAAAVWVFAGGMIAASPGDLWAPALFVPAAAALHLGLLPEAALESQVGRWLAWVPVTALGAAGLLLVPGTTALAPAVGILLLTPVTAWKGLREPRLDRLTWLAAGLGLLLLLIWSVPDWKPLGEVVRAEDAIIGILPTGPWAPAALQPFLLVAAALAAMHALAGLWGERRASRPVVWAALVAAMPVLALAVAYARVRGFAQDTGWAFAALGLAAALVGAAALAVRAGPSGTGATVTASVREEAEASVGDEASGRLTDPANPPDMVGSGRQRAGAHAAGAVAALSLGAAMVLSEHWLTLAVALLLPALAWIEARADLPALRTVALAVAGVVLVRLLLNGAVLDYAFGGAPLLNGIWAAYGVPAAAFALASVLFRRRRDDALVAVLEAGAVAFVGALVLLLIRHAMNDGNLAAAWSFREGALDVLAAAMLAANLRFLDRRLGGRPVIGTAWRLVQVLAVLLGVTAILSNPTSFAGAGLLPYPVLNELLIAYAVPAALAAGAMPHVRDRLFRGALGLYAAVSAFAWVTLEVRHHFHPEEMSLDLKAVGDVELWAYSGAWLAFGAVLLALGIRQGARGPRLAALAVLGITVGKVFLVDMAALTGLWRVLSFLGLGLALIALGRVYRRFVVVPGAPPA